MTPPGAVQTDSTKIIRESRDRPLIVVDASVAVKWIAPEAGSDAALTLVSRSDLIAPDLLLIEVANAVRRKVKDGELAHEQGRLGLLRISQRIELRASTVDVVMRAFNIALLMAHPVYDCIYLALAESTSSNLVTFNDELGGLATQHGLGGLVTMMPPPELPS